MTTYKWELVKTKGKSPAGRHSHSAVVVKDIMYIIGGTTSQDLFLKEDSLNDIYMLDLKQLEW